MTKGPQLEEIEFSCASMNLLTGPSTLSAKVKKVGDQIISPIKTNARHTAEIAAIRPYFRGVDTFLISGIGLRRSRIGVGLLWI